MSLKRSGLGKNLSALLGNSLDSTTNATTAATATAMHATALLSPAQLGKLPLESLVPGKYQPRRTMEEESLQELADSIKRQGLLQPILVRKLNDNTYEIIAGERRFRAAKLAGLIEVPIVIHQVDDETTMAIALVENLQREDLNPIDQARAMSRLTHEFSLTHQEIAQLLSKSRASVSNFLRLLSLSPDVITLVEKGELDMGHARSLLTLNEEQQIQTAKHVINKNLSVRNTEEFVNRMKDNEGQASNKSKKIPTYPTSLKTKIEALGSRLQTKVKIKHESSGKGAIVIHYDSLEALEAIVGEIG